VSIFGYPENSFTDPAGSGSGAASNAPYVTYDTSADLSAERVLTAGNNVTIDTSVAGQVILNAQATGSGAPTTCSYITVSNETSLSNERILTAANGITIVDNGANSTIDVGISNTVLGAGYLTIGSEAILTAERSLVGTRGILTTDGGANSSFTLAVGGVTSTSTSPYNVSSSEFVILVDSTSGAKTVNLPAPASYAGRVLIVKKFDNSVNTVTINRNSSESIDGATNYLLSAGYQSVSLACDGTNWGII